MNTRCIFTGIENPFPAYKGWPYNDDTLEVVDIGREIAHLPGAEPRFGLEDGLVIFMREAHRCLEPGGILMIKAPSATSSRCIADPLAQRYFNRETWSHFGDSPDIGRLPGSFDFGFRFNVINVAQDGTSWAVTLEKPMSQEEE
jgi:hypothetical protein